MPVSEHLVGRAGELASLDQLLDRVDGGSSAAVGLVGEPGIGKTRLLAELSARADARGHLVLAGSASELERDLPFWVFVDALDEYVRGLAPSRLDSLDDDVRSELTTVFPSLSGLSAGREVAQQHERYRSHRAVRELLELLATSQPVVLILDDLHWADSASIELLGSLLHRLPGGPMVLALAMRPRQTRERLSASLERARRAGSLTLTDLVPLSRVEAQEFLGDAVEEEEAGTLYEETGGNPFYLEQLARSLLRAEGAKPARQIVLDGFEVPPTVVAALAEELALLSDEARRLLEGAAVAGDPFDPELARAAAGVDESAVLDGLDELLLLDVIRQTDVPRRFRFRHPLIRRGVYDSTPGGWRLGAHERTAEALAERGASVTARAHHVELSARRGDLGAVATLREAGEAAAQRAPASAAKWFGGALRLIPAETPAEERVELLLAQAEALAAGGHFADSHATLVESVQVVPEEAGELRVRLTAACARLEHVLGRHAEARARLESTLSKLDDPTSREAVALMIELAVDGFYRMDYEGMKPWAAAAVEAASALGDQTLTAEAFAVRAGAFALSGAVGRALDDCKAAAEVIDALSDDEAARRLDALAHLAIAELYLHHFEAAGRHSQRALTIGRSTGQGDLLPTLFPILGTALLAQGRVAEAVEVLEGAVEAVRLLDNVHGLAWILLHHAEAAFAAGDVVSAIASAEEGMELSKKLDGSIVGVAASVTLAQLMLATGQAARATELLLSGAGGEKLKLISIASRVRALELLTRCLLELGRRDEAERAAEEAAVCAEVVALPLVGATAELAAAALALHAGDPATSARRAVSAAAGLEEIGAVLDAALARMRAGHAMAQAGDHDEAAVELERAAAAFDSFGSHRYRAEAEQELRRLGRHIHRRTRRGQADEVGIESLTGRELQVARLVVDRLTNPEIAAELFLSLKTVETHMHNMFRKLGVASRVELARAVELADRGKQASSR
jgi:ATP/maltotriose-dependent transcriptional regulator MalT